MTLPACRVPESTSMITAFSRPLESQHRRVEHSNAWHRTWQPGSLRAFLACHNSLADITLSWERDFPIRFPSDRIDAMTSLWCGHELAVDGVIGFCLVQRFVDDAIRMAIGLRASGTVECILRRSCSKVMVELQMYSAGGFFGSFHVDRSL
jgi:hypothetical protein